MVKKELKAIYKVIEDFFRTREIQLEDVIIFGSAAKKNKTNFNDIDLILLSRNFRGKEFDEKIKMVSGINRELVSKFKKPFDLLFYSDSEWKKEERYLFSEAQKFGYSLKNQIYILSFRKK